MSQIIATISKTNEILEKYGLYAKKNYGQNFLVESQIVEKIAMNAMSDKPCVAFEIGPGIGALTQFLSMHATQVVAFEIDDRLIPVLSDTLSECENVEVELLEGKRCEYDKLDISVTYFEKSSKAHKYPRLKKRTV